MGHYTEFHFQCPDCNHKTQTEREAEDHAFECEPTWPSYLRVSKTVNVTPVHPKRGRKERMRKLHV